MSSEEYQLFWVAGHPRRLQSLPACIWPSETPAAPLLKINPRLSIINRSLFELNEGSDSKINALLMHGVMPRS